MEPVSLAVGLVPLYNAVINISKRVRDFKGFGDDSQLILLRFEASVSKLQSWAEGLGIGGAKLSNSHDCRLDEPKIASVVQNILRCLIEIFDKVDHSSRSLSVSLRAVPAGDYRWPLPGDNIKPGGERDQDLSLRSRLTWATGGKTRLEKDVRVFESLVKTLGEIVPPTGIEAQCLSKLASLEYKVDLLTDSQVNLEEIFVLATEQRQHYVDLWLDAIKGEDHYGKFVDLRLNGTCDWVRDHPSYVAWESSDFSNSLLKILWINGPAGFGKSVLCAALVQHMMAAAGLPLAYCFASSHAQNVQEMDGVVRTWIAQLVRQDRSILDLAYQLHRSWNSRRASRNEVWMLMRDIAKLNPGCVLVLDGLDEFPSEDDKRKQYLSDIKQHLSGTGCRILITSRAEFDIESEMRTPATDQTLYSVLECKISKHDVRADIDLVSKHIVSIRLSKQQQALRQELAFQMTERCDGQFLWLKFQQDQLRDSKSPKVLREIVQAMPKKLKAVYNRNWQFIQTLEESDRSCAIDMLRWLTFSYRPLRVQELAEASIISLDHEELVFTKDNLPTIIDDDYSDNEIRRLCGSFVRLQNSENPNFATVSLVHSSVQAFLAENLPLPSSIGPMSERSLMSAAQHADLAARCIRFLDCDEAWGGDAQTRPLFIEYAVNEWFQHLKNSSIYYVTISDLVNNFMKLGNAHFDLWKELFEQRDSSDIQEAGTSFYYACELGLVPVMDFLHESDPSLDINSRGGIYCTSLQAVCAEGNMEALERLLHWKADVTVCGGQYGNAINAAAYHNRINMVRALLQPRPSIKCLFTGLQEALALAASQGHVEMVAFLLDQGAEVNLQRFHGPKDWPEYRSKKIWIPATPIHGAAGFGHVDVAEMLIKRGADFNAQDKSYATPLHFAAFGSYQDVVKLLLEHGANPNITGRHGCPLHWATTRCSIEIIALLLDRHADVELRDSYDRTPLHYAAERANPEVVKVLCTVGANLNAQSIERWAPLHYAIVTGHLNTVTYLVMQGADINIQTEYGYTALHLSIIYNHSDIALFLLSRGALLATGVGLTPLHIAAIHGTLSLVMPFIQAGMDKNATCRRGRTPLHDATTNRQYEIVETLLNLGAIIQADSRGTTPLHHAAMQYDYKIMARLLKESPHINAEDEAGWTPLSYAACADGGLVDI